MKTYLKVSSVDWVLFLYDLRLEMFGIVVDWFRDRAAGSFPGNSTTGDVSR